MCTRDQPTTLAQYRAHRKTAQMTLTRASNTCAGCGKLLQPFSETTFTAHEFYCYKIFPDRIPERDRETFERELLGEQRSQAAKRGVETRRRNGGKRAPRPLHT